MIRFDKVSPKTLRIYERLMLAAVGETVTYAQLSEAVGEPVKSTNRWLQSAIRICQRKDSAVFDNVRNVGYRRLPDPDVVDLGPRYVKKVRRTAKRGVRRMSTIEDFGALSNKKKLDYSTNASVLATIAYAAGSKQIEKVRTKVADGELPESMRRLPIAETLAVFKNKKGKPSEQENAQ